MASGNGIDAMNDWIERHNSTPASGLIPPPPPQFIHPAAAAAPGISDALLPQFAVSLLSPHRDRVPILCDRWFGFPVADLLDCGCAIPMLFDGR